MTTTRSLRRARRVALATAGLGLAALTATPAAWATDYPPSGPSQGSVVLGVKHGPSATGTTATTSRTTSASTEVLGTQYSSSTLAYTGAEIGGFAATGLALLVTGALLVRGGRRRRAPIA